MGVAVVNKQKQRKCLPVVYVVVVKVDLMFGISLVLGVRCISKLCPRCDGCGNTLYPVDCGACAGKGAFDVWSKPCTPWNMHKKILCSTCHGKGGLPRTTMGGTIPEASYGGYGGVPASSGAGGYPGMSAPAPAPYSPSAPPAFSPGFTSGVSVGPVTFSVSTTSTMPIATCTVTHPWHTHPLNRNFGPSWICDGTKRPGGCKSGLTSSSHFGTVPRFRCNSGCDYDLCLSCVCNGGVEPVAHPWHPHFLQRSSLTSSWFCDGRKMPGGCRYGFASTPMAKSVARFRCISGCDFDLCDRCMALAVGTPKDISVIHHSHSHPLIRNYDDNGWRCDGSKRPGGCKRNITSFHQSKGIARFRCASCDFDLCDLCIADTSTR